MTTEAPREVRTLDEYLDLLDHLLAHADEVHNLAEAFNRQARSTMVDRIRTRVVELAYRVPADADLVTTTPSAEDVSAAIELGMLLDEYLEMLHTLGPIAVDEDEEDEDEDEDEDGEEDTDVE